MTRLMNFNAGPAALPLAALERAQAELLELGTSGMSVMEHSHRGKEYEAVHNDAISLVKSLLQVPDDYDILLQQGGASTQFAVVAMNLLHIGAQAQYIVTGAWGEKAFGEAKHSAGLLGGTATVALTTGVGDGKEKSYTRVPKADEVKVADNAAYVHLTSNETINGVQFGITEASDFPRTAAPLVADMSSDFMWRPFDISQFGVIYAGAQKNIGPSGLAVVIVKKDLVAHARKDIPKIFQYRIHAENNSLYNTPPTFGVYMMRNVLSWLKDSGGLYEAETRNRKKAAKVYAAIDAAAGFYKCPVEIDSRSVMNIVFRLPTEELENTFVAEAKKAGMVGLKGHRSVGGIRASTYNAVEPIWVDALAGFMADFAKANG